MDRILIAVDGSPSSDEAARVGLELAAEHGAAATFVHVAPTMDVLPAGGFGMTAAAPHELAEADRKPLDKAVKLAEEAGTAVRSELLQGDPADEIVTFADSLDADLIVVGSRGHGVLASALLGSVSRGVLREARRPVLVVKAALEHVAIPA